MQWGADHQAIDGHLVMALRLRLVSGQLRRQIMLGCWGVFEVKIAFRGRQLAYWKLLSKGNYYWDYMRTGHKWTSDRCSQGLPTVLPSMFSGHPRWDYKHDGDGAVVVADPGGVPFFQKEGDS